MAFAAPMLVESAAAGETAAAASGARAAGAGRATAKSGATSARSARTAPAGVPTATAAARADELVASGASRTSARRTLRHEYGATAEQADDLLDAAGGRVPPAPAGDTSAGDAPTGSGSSPAGTQRPAAPVRIPRAMNAGGGLVLGAIGYILGTVYLRGGSDGLKAWFMAKFLNKTTATITPANAAASAHAAPATGGGSNTGTGLKVLGTAPGAIGAAGNGASSSGGGGW